jgi:hypothetical protein
MTDSEVRALLSDEIALAVTMAGEARGEPVQGRIMVACIVRNRLAAGRWGDTVRAVCLAPAQFSCWWHYGGADNARATWALARLAVEQFASVGRVADPLLRECVYLARGVLSGEIRDITRGATHYVTRELFRQRPPVWTSQARIVAEIGAHVCFVGA